MKPTRQPQRKRDDLWHAAAEAGCDMALLERRLGMQPAERVAAHQRALALVRALRNAKVVRHG